MRLFQRDLRFLAKEVGLTHEKQTEIVRILKEDDYTAEFPLQDTVTYAYGVVLLNIIEDEKLDAKCLPLAISRVDPTLKHVGPSIKRSIERRVTSAREVSTLCCRIDFLYVEDNNVGSRCQSLNIDAIWLQGEELLPPNTVISYSVILELVQYIQKHNLQWSTAKKWMCRLFPNDNCDDLRTETIATNWSKIQKRARTLRGKKHYSAYLAQVYCPPKSKAGDISSPTTSGQMSPSSHSGETSAGPSPHSKAHNPPEEISLEDVISGKYDSPTKIRMVRHIRDQEKKLTEKDKEIAKLLEIVNSHKDRFSKVNDKYTDVVNKYLSAKTETKSITKLNRDLEKEIKEVEKEEIQLRREIAEKSKLLTNYHPENVTKYLECKELKINKLNDTVKRYTDSLFEQRNEMSTLEDELKVEKGKKRKEQKRVWWFKNKVNPLQDYKDVHIKELLKEINSLSLCNDTLDCQLQDAMNLPSVTTFANGKYVDAIRLVVYDFLSHNVGTQHVSSLIASVLQNLAGVEYGRLPKETLVKLMALEADMLSKKQVADALLHTSNATLHMDATSKKQRHYFSIQVSTPDQNFSAGLVETVSGDTQTQLDVTKDFFREMSTLLDNSSMPHSSNEYKLLFNIKNTMADRGPTSRSWVEQLQIWRKDILSKKLLPGYSDLSPESISALSTINDFYCGKHFLLGLAERTKVGLMLWEDEVAEITGQIGMEALPEFARWNCQKPAGLRLIRTACELVGSGAKDPHGIPEDFKAHLEPGEKNHIPLFEHNRFNIVFKAASAVYHHRHQLRSLLQSMQNDNRLHRAVLEDSANPIALAEVQAIALLEKHVTTPLNTISSKKDHILGLRKYYERLREFLQAMIQDPSPIIDGTAVLFEDCPPIKDEIWQSLYQEISDEQEALLDQLISVLCASFFVVCERQLFDFLHGKWAAEQSEGVHKETASVPRNNDISERDFSGLDRLLRSKSTANLDFIEGIILYVNNKTGQYLQTLSKSQLQKEIAMAMKEARRKRSLFKEKKQRLRKERQEAVLAKQKRREDLERNRLVQQQKVQDDIKIDGQAKSVEDMEDFLGNYQSVTDKRKAISRQLKYYRHLKIPGIPTTKFHVSGKGKALPIDILKENLLFIITAWSKAMENPNTVPMETEQNQGPNVASLSTMRTVQTLKRKLVEEAETERMKKARKYEKTNVTQASDFPGEAIVGQRIKQKYEVTKSGKVVKQWFKGTVIGIANEEDLSNISEEDQDIVAQGYTLFMVKYDNEEQVEPFALKVDWDNGELKLL